MRRIKRGILALVLAIPLAIPPSTASAQTTVFLGGGATIPTQDFGDFANTGWMGFGGVMFPVGEGAFRAGAEGYYGRNNHETDGERTDLYGALALASLSMGAMDAPMRPFVFGGLGSMTHSFSSEEFPEFDESETNLAAQFGAGVAFGAGGIGGLLAASATTGMFSLNSTTFASIAAAIQIPVGN